MTRFPARVAMVAAMAFLMCTQPRANADLMLDISGTFGAFTYGNQPAPLNGGSFSGSITLASLPSANTQYAADVTADVNFYVNGPTGNILVFSINSASSPVYATFTAGSSGYTQLTVAGNGTAGTTAVDVAPLSLEFNNWSFGASTGTVKPYGSPNYASSVEYTYSPSTTYFAPVETGTVTVSTVVAQALAPEPSTLTVSLVSMLGGLVYARCRRRPTRV